MTSSQLAVEVLDAGDQATLRSLAVTA